MGADMVAGDLGDPVPVGQGLSPWVEEGQWRHTQVRLGPESCLKGSVRPSTGLVFAYWDVVAGSPPSGVMNPTVDLQVRFFSPPRVGLIRFRARTLRLGRTLYVGEGELRYEDDDRPFGVATASFMNRELPFPDRAAGPSAEGKGPDGPGPSYRPLVGTRRVARGVLEMDADLNTVQGTVSGATLGCLVELAAVDLLSGQTPVAVDELDVRFLHKVRKGPLRATAVALRHRVDSGAATVRVEVTDRGDGDRIVTYALAVCH